MFDNVGKKIMAAAEILFGIEILACVITVIVLANINSNLGWICLLVAAVGFFLSWVNSLILYGFGQLVTDSNVLVKQTQTIQKNL